MGIYPLHRLTRLYDTVEQLEDLWGDDMQGDELDGENPGEEVWAMDEDGNWQQGVGDDDDEWEEEEEEDDAMPVDEDGWDADPRPPTPDVTANGNGWWGGIFPIPTWTGDRDSPVRSGRVRLHIPLDIEPEVTEGQDGVDLVAVSGVPDIPQPSHVPDTEDSPWKRFEILPEAPHDHAFYSSVPSQPSRQFLARLQKEYRALMNSLPGTHVPSLGSIQHCSNPVDP